jgi:hypothetical protein
MLTEEIRAALALPPAPIPKPEAVVQKYRSLPKEYRKAVNALHRAGGELPASEFPGSPSLRAALQELGFAYVLPSPERVVAPLETLFAVPLIEGNPETLLEALRGYDLETLRKLAAAARVEAAGLDEVRLRARLHRAATSGATLEGVHAGLLRNLLELAEAGGPQGIPVREFCRLAGIEAPSWDEGAVDALPKGDSELADLARRMLVTPVRVASDWTRFFNAVTVPIEMRRVLSARPAGAPKRSCGEEMEGAEFQPPPESDGRRLALLLASLERERVGMTRAGNPNLRDLGRLGRRLGWTAEEASQLAMLALAGGLAEPEERGEWVRPTEEGWAYLAGTPAERIRRLGELARGIARSLASEASPRTPDVIVEALLQELDPVEAVPGEKVCLHCAAGRAVEAIRKKLKELGMRPIGLSMGVEGLVRALGEVIFQFGLAEGVRRGDRLEYLRWSPKGGAAGGLPGTVTVQPTGEVIAPPGAFPPQELAALARAAEITGVEPVLVFSLTRATAMEAARRGEDLLRLRAILEARSGRPLPQAVAFLLEEIGSRVGEVRIVPCAAVVEVRDPAMLAGLNLVRISDRVAAVPMAYDPDAIRRELERQGYLVKLERPVLTRETLREQAEEAAQEDHRACREWGTEPEGVRKRVLHASLHGEPLEVEMRGGRRHCLVGVLLGEGRIEGLDRDTGRPEVLDAASVVRARSAPL